MLERRLIACLWACLVLLLSACKKEQPYQDSALETKEVLMDHHDSRISRCNTDQRMSDKYAVDPAYQREIREGRVITMHNIKDHSRSDASLEIYSVPIHFIIVHLPNHSVGSGTNISFTRIQSQLEALNLDFLRKNRDAVNTPAVFPAQSSSIQFCLATVDPYGNHTDGITRYATNSNFDENELSIKTATTWDPTRYLNVWVAPDIDGLGYAYLPSISSLPSRSEDGVVVLTEVFGGPNSGAEAPFDLGRTLTHEVGHYLGLDHIWGEGCNIDDGITDTPDQAEENVGCPNHPSPSCNNRGDMFMNYMDYSDDRCLNAFTAGQVAYMRRILETSRSGLLQPGRTECIAEPNEPTCNDGLKNGAETGIDCGGPDCLPCNNQEPIDAGIVGVQGQESGQGCNSRIDLSITIKNYGPSNLSSVNLIATLAGTTIREQPWSGNLKPGATARVKMENISLSTGQHLVTVTTSRPNGQADAKPHNDGASTSVSKTGGMSLTLRIQPDDYGSEIKWLIRNGQGEVVARGGNYEDFTYDLIEETICLPNGCYRLIMRDEYGDGICCDYGYGWYELTTTTGQKLVDSDGYYGYRESTSFCIGGGTSSRSQTDRDSRQELPRKKKQVSKFPAKTVN